MKTQTQPAAPVTISRVRGNGHTAWLNVVIRDAGGFCLAVLSVLAWTETDGSIGWAWETIDDAVTAVDFQLLPETVDAELAAFAAQWI